MIPSSASTSNWDFTSVINLLRSPTCQTNSPPDYPVASPASHETTKHDVSKPGIQEQHVKGASINSPKLGDFGSLWELLGNPSTSPASTDNKSDTETRELPKQSERRNHPIVILKRPAVLDTLVETTVSTPKTPLETVPVLSITDTENSHPHGPAGVEPSVPRQRRRHRNHNRHEVSLSECNAEGESDSSPSVFDPPLSHPRSIPPMVPPQVGVFEARAGPLETPPSSFEELDDFLTPNSIKNSHSSGTLRLQPLAYRTAADQRVGLLTKLLKDFPDYAELLVETGRSKKSRKLDVSSRPIHVFVDMSNIMVGFHDSAKISRNIPIQTRIRRLPLSYQNFSLILERGRSAAKRVLVGSDRIAAISESEQLGYEANILNRVQKIKQPTPRQLKFRRNPRVTSQDGGHGSETNYGAGGRWVEQGVDEILHLKILESLLDADEPATIVLATGDAAEAEFSGGFMKMVERALQRGWRVELISFSQVTSRAYQRKEFRSQWGDHTNIPHFTMVTFKPQDLYGGAIRAVIPEGWLDATDLRQIPDHQELFLSTITLSNLIFEINERVSEQTALSALQSAQNQEVLDILGANPSATPETIDKAAALYHLNDVLDRESDILQIVTPPQQVSVQKLAGAKSYKGVAQMTPSAACSNVPPSIGGAAAGSSAHGGLVSSVSVHYLLIRLKEQNTDILIFFNVPHKEFDERGDPRGLSKEEELASETIDGLIGRLEVMDWGLFGA
ncbi:hypothetical protein BJX76DRAFT_351143 [Aspergillus varians]